MLDVGLLLPLNMGLESLQVGFVRCWAVLGWVMDLGLMLLLLLLLHLDWESPQGGSGSSDSSSSSSTKACFASAAPLASAA